MKLTKEKLEQLIIEQYKSMSRRVLDKRRESPEGGFVRAFGEVDQPINRPEFHDKLTTLAGDDFYQAKELADSLDEPLDIKVDPSNTQTFDIPDAPENYFDKDGAYFTHAHFVMWANLNGYPELRFDSKVNPEAVMDYADSEGMDYEKTLSDIKFNISKIRSNKIKRGLGKFNPNTHMARTHGMDRDPFGDDDF